MQFSAGSAAEKGYGKIHGRRRIPGKIICHPEKCPPPQRQKQPLIHDSYHSTHLTHLTHLTHPTPPPKTADLPLFLKKLKKNRIFFRLGYCHFEKNDYNIQLAGRNIRVP